MAMTPMLEHIATKGPREVAQCGRSQGRAIRRASFHRSHLFILSPNIGGTIMSAFLVSRCFFFQRLSLDIVSESLKEKIASMQSSATCGFHTNTSKRYVQNESAGYTCPAFQVPVSINCQHGAISGNVSI